MKCKLYSEFVPRNITIEMKDYHNVFTTGNPKRVVINFPKHRDFIEIERKSADWLIDNRNDLFRYKMPYFVPGKKEGYKSKKTKRVRGDR